MRPTNYKTWQRSEKLIKMFRCEISIWIDGQGKFLLLMCKLHNNEVTMRINQFSILTKKKKKKHVKYQLWARFWRNMDYFLFQVRIWSYIINIAICLFFANINIVYDPGIALLLLSNKFQKQHSHLDVYFAIIGKWKIKTTQKETILFDYLYITVKVIVTKILWT
jgi:hypothetical protein